MPNYTRRASDRKRAVLVFRGHMNTAFSKDEITNVARELLATISRARGENGGAENGDAKEESATIVALAGDLGAGKTTLTQSIARELGITEQLISPTFVIMKKYQIPKSKSGGVFSALIHIDAYRLESSCELERLGWAELIADPQNLIIVEWPEKVPELMNTKVHRVTLSHIDENERHIAFD